MKRLLTIVALATAGTAAAQSSCAPYPSHAFNGLIKITYPKSKGEGAATLKRICTPETEKVRKEMMAEAKKKNIPLKWVEFYTTYKWHYALHGLIYETKPLGYSQADYDRYGIGKPDDTSSLVYANKSGKYITILSREVDKDNYRFIIYGN